MQDGKQEYLSKEPDLFVKADASIFKAWTRQTILDRHLS